MMISGHKTESVYKRYAISNREQRRSALAQIDEYRSKHSGESRTQNEHNSGVSGDEQSVVN